MSRPTEGDYISARAIFHGAPNEATTVYEYDHAAEGLYKLGNGGWELVNVVREVRKPDRTDKPDQVMSFYHLKRPIVDEEWRHCLLVSVESSEGLLGYATIFYLDWLEQNGDPHSDKPTDKYQGFKQLRADGWQLVQVIEKPAAEGMDGPIPPRTEHYFKRLAKAKG